MSYCLWGEQEKRFVQQLAAGRTPNRQLGIPDSRVGRVQLPQDRLGAAANRSAAMIRIAIPSLATLISCFSKAFGARFPIGNHRLAEVVVLSEQPRRTLIIRACDL